jgi:hypothetical protein
MVDASAGFVLSLLFSPEEGEYVSAEHSELYSLQPRRPYSSNNKMFETYGETPRDL